MKLTVAESDCGKMFGIPYMKDKRVKTGVTYQVRFKKIDDQKSNMDLKISIDGYMDTNEGAPFFVSKDKGNNKILMCKSTGALEKKFKELIGVSVQTSTTTAVETPVKTMAAPENK